MNYTFGKLSKDGERVFWLYVVVTIANLCLPRYAVPGIIPILILGLSTFAILVNIKTLASVSRSLPKDKYLAALSSAKAYTNLSVSLLGLCAALLTVWVAMLIILWW